MQSLILPLLILVLVGTWGVFETGRKFRREFHARGKSWESVCANLERGEGVLVVDTLWGPQRGLGHPVIWWLAAAPAEGEEMADRIRGEMGGAETSVSAAWLVRCPRRLRSVAALRAKFGPERVMLHTWAVEEKLLDPAAKQT